ncbi:MAG: hypothetical protein HQK53_04285 [Oligoflexia bacterium]|nr:hypothetical protein [Oligoflexia bacterium]
MSENRENKGSSENIDHPTTVEPTDQSKLQRKEIPAIKLKKIRKGPRCIQERSFPVGNQSFFRVFQGDNLTLRVVAEDMINDLQVLLHTDVNGTGNWEDIPFTEVSKGEFAIEVPLKKCGLFRFKIKYSFNFGNSWYWDNVPYSTFYVDPAAVKSIKMYTLIPTISGHIGDWITLLHHIKDLGMNTVHLLPITELDSSESPYAARDIFAIDYSYSIPGDKRDILDQFESFVEEAKKLGIKLCIDLVLNHIGIGSKIAHFCSDWIATDSNEKDTLKRAGCWDNLKWVRWEDLAVIKYDHAVNKVRHEIWYYMKKYAIFWANYAYYTGGMVRLDNLHSTNIQFFHYLNQALRQEYPDLVVFAELFTDPTTTEKMVLDNGINLLLATPWFNGFARQMREFIIYNHKIYSQIRYIFPLNSHDSGSPAQEYGGVKATIPRYVVCALMGTGHTGFTQGVEFGIPKKINFIGRQKKLELSEKNYGYDFSPLISAINRVFDESPVFRTGGNLHFVDEDHSAIMAAYRFNPQNKEQGMIVIANLDTSSKQTLSINIMKHFPFLIGKILLEKISNRNYTVTTGHLDIELEACGFCILEVTK